MNTKEAYSYVQRYLEATESTILEKSNAHIKVKLSQAADKELTNRPFYWSFVERSSEEPQTLTFCLIFDPVQYEQYKQDEEARLSKEEQLANKILERTFGVSAPPLTRVISEHLFYGSPRLEQIFSSAKQNGRYVCMFEETKKGHIHPLESIAYTAWLGINYKVEFCSDKKREELHCLGVSLVTGFVAEQFYEQLTKKRLSPKLPSNIHIAKQALSYTKAVQLAEQHIERKLKLLDYEWAQQAKARQAEELERISSYYEPLINISYEDEEQKAKILQQYEQRKEEIKWQFEPRIAVSVMNCGLFHLEGID